MAAAANVRPECAGMSFDVGVDNPRAEDVRALMAIHLGFSLGVTPPEYSFALDSDELADPSVTFFSAREAGRLVGIAALQRLDDTHAELKSMHTREAELAAVRTSGIPCRCAKWAESVGQKHESASS